MAQTIKIKRTLGNGIPTSTAQGELFYVYDTSDNGGNNADRLFIGNPNGGANTPLVIGGTYFTEMLDHTAGTLTASSAIIVDASSKIDVLNVDNITINGNAITSTDTNGNLELTPNGTGNLVLDGVNWPQADGTAGYFLKTDGAGQAAWAEVISNFTISDGTNSDIVNTGETLTFTGGTGVTTTASPNEVTFAIGQSVGTTDNVTFNTVTADLTGNVTGDLTGNVTGNVTGAVTGNVTGDLTGNVTGNVTGDLTGNVTGNVTGAVTGNVTGDLTGNVTGNVTGQVSDISNHDTSDLTEDPSATTTSGTMYFTEGRARAAISVSDNGGDGSLSYDNATGVISYTGPSDAEIWAHFSGSPGVDITSGVISIGQPVGTGDGVTFATVTTTGDLSVGGNTVITGNLTVNGTTTTINSNTVDIGDNIIVLNGDEVNSPTQNAGIEIERGTDTNVVLRWNETDDEWEVTVDGTNYYPIMTSNNFEAQWDTIDGGTF